jgi:hypothetical protein
MAPLEGSSPRLREEEAGRRFLEGLTNGRADHCAALNCIESRPVLRRVLLRANRATSVSGEFRSAFHLLWTERGHRLRELLNDDLLLIGAARRLLPSYTGPSLTLYRGEAALRRKHRRYGFAWSAQRATAEMFGRGLNAMFEGGGVVLMTEAPPRAIVAGPSAHSAYLDEDEYTVDRRLLNRVVVLARYPRKF